MNRNITVKALGLLVLAALLCACREHNTPKIQKIEPGQYTLSSRCGECHRDIHAGWASSMHANAGLDALFRRAFDEAAAVDRPQAEALCSRCHNPARVYGAANITAAEALSDGIGCDFCHSIAQLDRSHQDRPYVVEFGPTKRGPIKNADSMAHLVAYSDLHMQSEICAGCHEFSTPANTPILSTYSEWQKSSYAKAGVNCQRCHMPYVMADVVDPQVKRISGVAVNLHQMPGGHSRQMMFKALRTNIASVKREKGRILVAIEIANKGAGHSVPTGMPTRQVVLTVELNSEKGGQQKREVIFERKVLDSQGQQLLRDSDLFVKGASIQFDNRLTPGESRLEKFDFEDLPEENLTVQTRLTYVYSPHASKETEVRFDFFNEEKHLVAQFSRRKNNRP